jgi:hypothetical protein
LEVLSGSAAAFVGQLPELLATAICLSELLAPSHPVDSAPKAANPRGGYPQAAPKREQVSGGARGADTAAGPVNDRSASLE